MVRKYKLIKEYPQSPTLNSIVEKQGKCYEVISDNVDEGREIHSNFIENFPEFWKEVIERDYEVLEFKADLSDSEEGLVFKLVSKNKYITGKRKSTYCFEVFREINNVQITKVKRLSDGEVFEEGDIVEVNDGRKFKILKILIRNDKCRVCGIDKDFVKFDYIISDIKKYKKSTTKNPPLGIMPRYLWIEQRFSKLEKAIGRSVCDQKQIPEEWWTEYSNLKEEINNRNNETQR